MSRIRISAPLAYARGSVIIWGLLIPVFLSAQTAENLAQRAVQLQQSHSYAEAAEVYRALLKLLPDDVATHVNLGVVLVNLGRYSEAITEYDAAEKLLPGDPRIGLNIALAYEKSGRFEEAQKRFETMHAAAPEDTRITMLLADSHLQSGENDRVIQLLQPLRDSSDLGVAYMLGMALLRTQHIEEAQSVLDRILRNGDTPESRFLLGTRMFESHDYPAAVKQLASAIELNPNLPGLESLYGRALLNTGDLEAAAAAFQKELAGNPNDYGANIGEGQILIARKRYAEGLPVARRALATRPGSSEAKLLLAQCLAGTQQFQDARPYAEAAVQELPKSADAHETMAAVDSALRLTSESARERKLALSLEQAEAATDPGPKLDQIPPAFTLPNAVSGKPVHLADFRGKTPVVLVFGSYSCPNFRSSAEALKSMQQRYGTRVPFLLIYIREAHATGDWQSTRNMRDGVTLPPAATMAEKESDATMCSRKLHLPFPALVDGMDGAVETAYNAWPSRAFIIDKEGRVVYSTRLTELDFHAETMESVLRGLGSEVITSK
ncbi:MAG: tetratricopeptide repeat protein [Acidobacteriota bacterium]|nr:tetratricopeptide repeat protein [Acidobacteriota bacterium]